MSASVKGGDNVQYITLNDLFGYTESICAVITVLIALLALFLNGRKK